MSIEQFTKQDFEKTLLEIFKPMGFSWVCDGYRANELRYHAVVRKGICIEINSSIGTSGHADGTGENSIRIWLADEDGKPLAKKEQAYVTRVPGWQLRMRGVIVSTIAHSKELVESPACPKCGGPMVLRSRRSDNKQFWGCKKFPNCNGARDLLPVKQEQHMMQGRLYEMNGKPLAEPIVAPMVNNPVEEILVPQTVIREYSKYQKAIFAWVEDSFTHFWLNNSDTPHHLVVEALAGTGKTTTGVEMLKRVPPNIDVLFLSFGVQIVKELLKRAPQNVSARTYNSLGFEACRKAYGNIQVDEFKVDRILENLLDKYTYKYLFPAIKQLVSLVKANLCGTSPTELIELADYHGIEMNGDEELIFETVALAIEKDRKMTGVVDYDDQCWLPIINNLPCRQYDLIFIDEAQDTNKCQIALAMKCLKANGRIVAVGDRHQSLYGFRGADVNAIPNLILALHAATLPLSLTYRCPKVAVRLCNETFPEIPIECPEWAKEGTIMSLSPEKALVEYRPGDMVLCRTNAPLVELAFALIRKGVKAIIRGRDIGKGLLVLVRKMKAYDIRDLLFKLTEYKNKEVTKLLEAEKNNQASSLQDKVDTIIALADGIDAITELEERITNIFDDDVQGVVFSSVHRAKGLEAERVFILKPELMPHPMAKKAWEQEQERNIKYVAYTRTLDVLVFVS